MRAGEINAIGLIDEILHMVFALYRKQLEPKVLAKALDELTDTLGEKQVNLLLTRFTEEFPPSAVYLEDQPVKEYLVGLTAGVSHKLIALEEIIMLWVTNQNPAVSSFSELFDDTQLSQATIYRQVMESLQLFFKDQPDFGPDQQDLLTMLRAPAVAVPNSLSGQLEYIRKHWVLLGDTLQAAQLTGLDHERKLSSTPGHLCQ